MKLLDKLSPPETLWYEDAEGNEIDWDKRSYMPPDNWSGGRMYQHSMNVVVEHSICEDYQRGHWVVRFLYWLISKMPTKWQRMSSQRYRGQTGIGAGFDIINYLVRQRNFRFEEACVIYADLCEHCINKCEYDLVGRVYSSNSNTYCKHCPTIDPKYAAKHHLWCCYRTFKLGGDVAKAYKNVSVYSDEKYMKENRVSY